MHELAEHVLDLIYNSIEAGGCHISVAVSENGHADRLTIAVADDGCGMEPEQVKRALDPFYTSRTTRKVGLGLPLLAERAHACGGHVTVCSHPGMGTTVSANFERSHVDRQPLGDMASTLMVALVAAPHVEFRYRHEVDGRVFAFCTTELREEVGDVSPAEPMVARWLRDYLEEHIIALGGETAAPAPVQAPRPAGVPGVLAELAGAR